MASSSGTAATAVLARMAVTGACSGVTAVAAAMAVSARPAVTVAMLGCSGAMVATVVTAAPVRQAQTVPVPPFPAQPHLVFPAPARIFLAAMRLVAMVGPV